MGKCRAISGRRILTYLPHSHSILLHHQFMPLPLFHIIPFATCVPSPNYLQTISQLSPNYLPSDQPSTTLNNISALVPLHSSVNPQFAFHIAFFSILPVRTHISNLPTSHLRSHLSYHFYSTFIITGKLITFQFIPLTLKTYPIETIYSQEPCTILHGRAQPNPTNKLHAFTYCISALQAEKSLAIA